MTPLNIAVFLLSLAGFVALAAGMSKHAKHLLRRELPPAVSRLLRALGWLLLAAALAIGIRQWHADVGLVTWLGWLTVAGLLLVFYLPRWPWQPVTKAAKPRPEKPYTPVPRSSRHVALGALLLAAPLVLFTWQLITTPERPLLGSLLLGLWSEGDDGPVLQHIGVSASFTEKRRAELWDELSELACPIEEHPWARWHEGAIANPDRVPGTQSRWSAGKALSFVPLRPERVLEVKYDHMEGRRFRHTAHFKRWRDDRDPTSCGYEQLDEVTGYDLDQVLGQG